MGIHQKFFEEPSERSQHAVNRDFYALIPHAFTLSDVSVYEHIFDARERGVSLVPVEDAEARPFDWQQIEWEWDRYYRERYNDDIPPGWTGA